VLLFPASLEIESTQKLKYTSHENLMIWPVVLAPALDDMKQQLQQQSSTKFILPALLTA
jgi:hypothetical protein